MRSLITSTALIAVILASSAHSAHAVNIAIIDTGLNGGVLGNFIEPGGFDFWNNDNDPSDESEKQHGTAVGHVAINSGSGITLTAIKAQQESCCASNSVSSEAFSYVASLGNVQIVNYSGAQLTNTPLASIKANTDAGKIVVLQAGNQGGASPAGDAAKASSLDGLGMVAGGLTPDGTDIQIFSNRAGSQKDHYILAQTNSLITKSNGTSMATPRVSAAAATVWGKYPFLKPEQVVQVLFDSADDLGAPGVDSTYGHGALNLGAALRAVGQGEIPSDGDGDGGGGGGGAGVIALAVGGAVAASLMNKEEELQSTILVDAYGRAFRFGLADRITIRDNRPNVFSLIERQKQDLDIVTLQANENGFTQAFVGENKVRPFGYTAGDEQVDNYISFLHRANTPNSQYALGLNSDLSADFGALSLRDKNRDAIQSQFYMSELFSTPVLGYSSMGSSFMYGFDNDAINHRFGVSVINDQEENGQVSNSLLYETSMHKNKYRLGMQLGAMVEDGSLLGGAGDSVLGVDQTSTYYIGFNGSYNLTRNIALLGGYFQGMSSVDEGNNSLLSEVSGLRTEGYAVGLLIDNLFTPKGTFGFSYSSPLQTTSGSATLTLPVSQNATTGAIGFESSNLSFSDAEKEKVFEAYYNYQLNHYSSVFTHLSYTQNPLNNLSASSDRTVYVGWKRRF